MQITSTIPLYNYKVPVIATTKKLHILSWSRTGKLSKTFSNKIQGLPRTAKKQTQDFPGCGNPAD